MVLHSGNHEIIGIRHRKTQTLYISCIIEPHSCSNPAYGMLQVGIYIAALQDTIDREMQGIEPAGGGNRDPPVDVSLEDDEANPDADLGDPPGRPTRSNKHTGNPDSKRQPKGKSGGRGKRAASGKVIENQVGTFCVFLPSQ